MRRGFGRLRLRLLLDRRLDRLDRPVSRQRLVYSAAGLGIDARLQFPGLAAGAELAYQGEQVVAILLMRAGQKRQPAVMLDYPIVVLGEAELFERIVERPARGDEKDGHMEPPPRFRRFVLGHPISSRELGTPPEIDIGTGRRINRSGSRRRGSAGRRGGCRYSSAGQTPTLPSPSRFRRRRSAAGAPRPPGSSPSPWPY